MRYNIGEVRDGDTVYLMDGKVVINHADGTQTIKEDKSLIKRICQKLKSIVQKFRLPKLGKNGGKQTNDQSKSPLLKVNR